MSERPERSIREVERPSLKFALGTSPTSSVWNGPPSGYQRRMRTGDDEDDLRSEVGQTLALFGMSLAVVLVGLLVGLGL